MENGVTGYFDLTHASTGTTVRIHYSQTYDIPTNTSKVAITKVQVKSSTNSGYIRYLDGSISVADTVAVEMDSFLGTHSIYVDQKNTFYDVEGELGSVDGIVHNDDGSRNITISASIRAYRSSGGSDWNVSGSTSVVLTTIPRASVLSVKNGTLGTEQTLTVERKSTVFSHTIKYTCGTKTGTICSKSKSESIKFTLPIELASQNTSGTSVTVKFTLQTYSGDTTIASPVSVTVAMAIPASVKPSCSISVEDAMGYASQFGGYVQGESKLSVAISTVVSYGAKIVSYHANANGSVYNTKSFETEALTTAGNQTISAKVTDKRGRTSDVAKTSINVLAYVPPVINSLAVHRCDADGKENPMGFYAKVTYSHEITSLSSKNAKNIVLKYKKGSETEYTSVTLNSAYSTTGAEHIFAADDGSSYDIILVVEDSFHFAERVTSVSTADVIMHFRADGKGMGMGKVSEVKDAVDLGWDIVMNEHSISGLPTPVEPTQAVPRSYVDTILGFGPNVVVATDEQIAHSVDTYLENNPIESVAVDATLTKEGMAADAKAVGEALKNIGTGGGSGGSGSNNGFLIDRTTGKKYEIFVANGKLTMAEAVTESDGSYGINLIDRMTNDLFVLYVANGNLTMTESEG